MLRQRPFRLGTWLAVGVVLAAGACYAGSSRRPARASAAWERAVNLQKRLEAKPPRSRSKAEYKRAIRQFWAVYWNDYAYAKAPAAAKTRGDLYAEMAKVFSNPTYFQNAIKAYRWLISQYPLSSASRQASLDLAKVYLSGLHDPEQSAEVYQSLLKHHPRSPEAREARKQLRDVEGAIAQQKEKASGASGQTSHGVVEVTDVHDWVGPNYTRVVIGAKAPVKFETLRLMHPDRIVFDLPNTRASRTLLRKNFPIIDGHFLREIRVGSLSQT